MNHINNVFFEEYKKLDNLCSDIYNSPNGVTHYIDDMKAVSYSNYHSIPNWESDLRQLKRLRHIRNNLAHVSGSFYENTCTTSDVRWLQTFAKRILNQSDPLAMLRRNSKKHARTTRAASKISKASHPKTAKKNASLLAAIIISALLIILAFLIALLLIMVFYL